MVKMSKYLNTPEVRKLLKSICDKDLWVNCDVFDEQSNCWYDDCFIRITQAGDTGFWFNWVFLEGANDSEVDMDEILTGVTYGKYIGVDVVNNPSMLSTDEIFDILAAGEAWDNYADL